MDSQTERGFIMRKKIIGYKTDYLGVQKPIYASENNDYAYTLGYDGKLRVNFLDYLPPNRYLIALVRLREQIKNKPLIFDDCELTGNKNTYCSWGLCCEDIAVYPERKDWIWPNKQLTSDKVDPLPFHNLPSLYMEDVKGIGQACPFEWNNTETDRLSGCFYRCRIFQEESINRKKALNLVNSLIDKWEKRLGRAVVGTLTSHIIDNT